MNDKNHLTCLNCAWAKWKMTAHNPPRINRNQVGWCEYPSEEVMRHIPRAFEPRFRTLPRHVYPDEPWADCPTWRSA